MNSITATDPNHPTIQGNQFSCTDLICKVLTVALKILLSFTLIVPLAIGLYELLRPRVENLYAKEDSLCLRVTKAISIIPALSAGFTELWGEGWSAEIEHPSPEALKQLNFSTLNPTQLTRLLSRKEVVQQLTQEQLCFALLSNQLNKTLLLSFICESDGSGKVALGNLFNKILDEFTDPKCDWKSLLNDCFTNDEIHQLLSSLKLTDPISSPELRKLYSKLGWSTTVLFINKNDEVSKNMIHSLEIKDIYSLLTTSLVSSSVKDLLVSHVCTLKRGKAPLLQDLIHLTCEDARLGNWTCFLTLDTKQAYQLLSSLKFIDPLSPEKLILLQGVLTPAQEKFLEDKNDEVTKRIFPPAPVSPVVVQQPSQPAAAPAPKATAPSATTVASSNATPKPAPVPTKAVAAAPPPSQPASNSSENTKQMPASAVSLEQWGIDTILKELASNSVPKKVDVENLPNTVFHGVFLGLQSVTPQVKAFCKHVPVEVRVSLINNNDDASKMLLNALEPRDFSALFQNPNFKKGPFLSLVCAEDKSCAPALKNLFEGMSSESKITALGGAKKTIINDLTDEEKYQLFSAIKLVDRPRPNQLQILCSNLSAQPRLFLLRKNDEISKSVMQNIDSRDFNELVPLLTSEEDKKLFLDLLCASPDALKQFSTWTTQVPKLALKSFNSPEIKRVLNALQQAQFLLAFPKIAEASDAKVFWNDYLNDPELLQKILTHQVIERLQNNQLNFPVRRAILNAIPDKQFNDQIFAQYCAVSSAELAGLINQGKAQIAHDTFLPKMHAKFTALAPFVQAFVNSGRLNHTVFLFLSPAQKSSLNFEFLRFKMLEDHLAFAENISVWLEMLLKIKKGFEKGGVSLSFDGLREEQFAQIYDQVVSCFATHVKLGIHQENPGVAIFKELFGAANVPLTQTQKAYKTLGLPDDAPWESIMKGDVKIMGIKEAYKKAALQFHPDKISRLNLPAEQVETYAQKFREAKEAYDHLESIFAPLLITENGETPTEKKAEIPSALQLTN